MSCLALAKSVIRSNFKHAKTVPYKLTLRVTKKCNFRCKTCNIWKERPEEELSITEYKEFFRRVNYYNWIDVTGGEIFLRDDIDKIFDLILDNCRQLYLLHFPTNGFLRRRIVDITKKVTAKTSARVIITVSIDAYPQLNDFIRGMRESASKAVQTFRELEKIKKAEVFVGLTLSEHNLPQLSRIEDWFNRDLKIPLDRVHINFMNRSDHFFNNGYMSGLDTERILPVLEKLYLQRGRRSFSPLNQMEKIYLNLAREYFLSKKTPLPCHALRSSCFVDSDGTVYPCTIWGEKIGNIRHCDFDLNKLWEGPDAEQARRKISSYECPNCWTPCEAYQSILGSLGKVSWLG